VEVSDLVSKVESVGTQTPVSKALSIIAHSPLKAAVVVDNKQVVGIVDDRCLLDFHEDPLRAKCENVMLRTAVASEATTPEELVLNFFDTHSRIIPLVNKKGLVGAISRTSSLKLLLAASATKGKTVADFMSRVGATIEEGATVTQARSKMRELGVFHLAVVDSNGKLSGSISSFEVACRVVARQTDRPPREIQAAPTYNAGLEKVVSVMLPANEAVSPETSLRQAIDRMLAQDASALFVVEGGVPMGLLSVRDVLHSVIKPAQEPVLVYGLREDEKPFVESIRAAGAAFLAKIDRSVPADYLAIHVKSFQEGKKRRYNVKGKLLIHGKYYSASTPETSLHKSVWDLNASIREVLHELSRITSDHEHGKPRAKKRKAHAAAASESELQDGELE